MERLKKIIAEVIANNFYVGDNPTYEQLLFGIDDNYYRTIGKANVSVFVIGIVQHFVIKDIDHANRILVAIKEVVTEALEINGIELTYTDTDWLDLKIIENNERWGSKYRLSNYDKKYMGEFFEI
jgi:hypothetical protein